MTKRRGKKHLEKAIKSTLDVKSDKPVLHPALVGAYLDGAQTIAVSGRPDYIWVRIRGATSEVAVAFNDKVAQVWDLPILVYRDPDFQDRWRVYGRDIRAYEDWGGVSYVAPHGASHSFSSSERSGVDIAWIYKRQYNPLQPRPVVTGTAGIYLEPDFYYAQGAYHWWPGSGTGDLISGNLPTGAHNGRYVTVYIDAEDRIPGFLLGPEFNIYFPPADPGEYIALPDPSTGVPIGAVRLYTGTTEIGWNEIYDLRSPQQPLNPSGSVIDVYDENVLLGSARGFNFVGDGVQAVISGTVAHVMHTGSAGGHETGTMVLYDEGDWIGVFDEMRFIGEGVSVFNSGSYAAIAITGTAGGGGHETGTLVVYEEDTFLGVFEEMRFIGDGITAYNSGSYVAVVSTGTASDIQGTGTYVRSGEAYPLVTITGGYWNVTEGEYMTGTLAIALNGVWQTPVTDFAELYPPSGTFAVVGPVETGTVVSAIWGAPDSGGGGGGDGHLTGTMVTYDENTFVGVFEEYRFIGPGVSVFNSGSYGAIAITGTAGGGGGHETGTLVVYDEDDWLGVFEEMRFIGPGVSAFNSGSYVAVAITGTAGGGGHETGTMVTYDEDDFVGVFEEYRFKGAGVQVYNSGSYGAIDITGGGGALTVTTGTFTIEELFYDHTVTGSSAIFDATGISPDYRSIRVECDYRATGSTAQDRTYMFFNNDLTGANYRAAYHFFGSSHLSGALDIPEIGHIMNSSASDGEFAGLIAWLENYNDAHEFAFARAISNMRSAASAYGSGHAIAWENKAVVNRITIKPADSVGFTFGEFEQGSSCRMYGIKEETVVTSVEGTVVGNPGDPVTVTTGTFYVEEVLYDVTLGSSTGSIVVPAISQEYDHLRLILDARADVAAVAEGVRIYFNGDTTNANYRYGQKYAGFSEGIAVGDEPIWTNAAGATSTALTFAMAEARIDNYAVTGTYRKQMLSWEGERHSPANIYVRMMVTYWENPAAINRIDIVPETSNFVANTRFQIVGIKETVLVTSVEGGGQVITGSFAVFDESVSLGQVGALNFVGDGVEAVVSGTVAHIMHTGSGGGGGGAGDPVAFTTGTFYLEEIIYDETLAATTGSVIIPGIPQEYDHLKLRIRGRSDDAGVAPILLMYYNDDQVAASYRYAMHWAGVAHGTQDGDGGWIGTLVGQGSANDDYSSLVVDMLDYTVTGSFQVAQAFGGERQNASVLIREDIHTWEKLEAINRIDLVSADGNIEAGSHIQLVGIKEQVVVTAVDGGGPVVTGSFAIFDEGTPLGQAGALNFVGDGVEAVISGTVAHIMHTGSAGGGGHETGTMVIYDEGDWLGVFDEMRFIGPGVSVFNSGSYAAIAITGTAGGGGGDDPLTVTTGTFYIETLLYDVTLASSTGSVVFPVIPQDYDHLKLIVTSRLDAAVVAEWLQFYFNNDTASASYRYARHYGGSAHGVGAGDDGIIGVAAGANALAGQYGINIIELPDYTVTGTFALARMIGGERNTASTLYERDNLVGWEKYEAINRIDCVPSQGDWVAGSHFQLIAVKEEVVVTSVEGTVSQQGITTGSSVIAEWEHDGTATGAFSLVVPAWAYDLYDDVQLLVCARTDRSGQSLEGLRMQFAPEGGSIDTGNNYWRRSEENYSGGSTTESDLAAANIFLGRFAFGGATAVAGRFGHGEFTIMGALKPTDAPTIQGSAIIYDINTNWRRDLVFGGWRTQERLGQIDIWTANASNYVSGSYARLIGLPAKDVSGGGGAAAGGAAILEVQVFS